MQHYCVLRPYVDGGGSSRGRQWSRWSAERMRRRYNPVRHKRAGEGREPHDILSCDMLDEVAPVGADVGKSPRCATFFHIDPPVVVGPVEEPVLEVVAMEQVQAAEQTIANHGASLLDHGIVAGMVIDSG